MPLLPYVLNAIPSQPLCAPNTRVCSISYVQLAVRLGEDAAFRAEVVDLIDLRQWALWERRDEVQHVPYAGTIIN